MSWIGFDLDGTLAKYGGWNGSGDIGEPIAPMVSLALDLLNAGKEVRIVTARAGAPELVPAVKAWCVKHLGREVQVTDRKDFHMELLYDDRARQVEFNTGRIISD